MCVQMFYVNEYLPMYLCDSMYEFDVKYEQGTNPRKNLLRNMPQCLNVSGYADKRPAQNISLKS